MGLWAYLTVGRRTRIFVCKNSCPYAEENTIPHQVKELLAKRMAEFAERKNFRARTANETAFEIVAAEFKRLHVATLLSKTWGQMLPEICERFKGRKIGEITPADIQRFYNEVQARASASTANRFLTLLCLLFNKAKAWGHFYGDNPCAMVKKQREPNHRMRKGELSRPRLTICRNFKPFMKRGRHESLDFDAGWTQKRTHF